MKKRLLCLLCLLVLLLAGCTGEEQETTPSGNAGLEGTDGDFSYYINISSQGEWDLCPVMDTRLTYMLLTGEPLKQDSEVWCMIAEGWESMQTQCSEEWMTQFPFWLYQTYRGMDWKEMAALKEAAQGGDEAAKEKLAAYETMYLEDYEALTPQDLPQIYGYWVTNDLTATFNNRAARYEEIPFSIDGVEMDVAVGTLNVHDKGWDQYPAEGNCQDVYAGRLSDARPTYWGDGIVTLEAIKIASEDTPQTLTELALYGIVGEILDIQVSVGGDTRSWDGSTPIEIPANTSASLTVTLKTQANQTVGYCEDANILIQREVEGLTQRLWYFAAISQSWNIYELYAMMVDGLDIGAYYAYSAGWEQPEPRPLPQTREIPLETVTVADTEDYALSVTGAELDDFAYTLRFSAQNRSDQVLDLVMGNPYWNQMALGGELDFSIHLEPGEAGEFAWVVPWEALEEWGIQASTGEDITSIEFILTPMRDGELPTDQDGKPFIPEEYTCIYPLGEEAVTSPTLPETLLLETDRARLYAVAFETEPHSRLVAFTWSPMWEVTLLIENLDKDNVDFVGSDCRVNGVAVDLTAVCAVRGESYALYTLYVGMTEETLERIGEPETMTFVLTENNTDTYTVTIDLTKELGGE